MEDDNKNQNLIEKILFQNINESRRSRRWGIFFKLLTFTYLFLILFYFIGWFDKENQVSNTHTGIIKLEGVIMDGEQNNSFDFISSLQNAFKNENIRGIIIKINSPGGSPVQSEIIFSEIMRLKSLYPKVPIYSVVEDMCTSGAYYVAAATDRIYVNKSSIVGSIGVLMNGFGFVDSMKKIGVERRLITSGEKKGILDPFSPLENEEVSYIKNILSQIHQAFIEDVKKGRSGKLKDSSDIFSGLIWTGHKSIELGLADEIGSIDFVAREVIKETNFVDYTLRESFAEKLANELGTKFNNLFYDFLHHIN